MIRRYFMKKIMALLLSALFMLAAFCSCGNAESGDYYNEESMPGMGSSDEMTSYPDIESADRKISKTYRLTLETTSYDEAVEAIKTAVETFGGYVASSSEQSTGTSNPLRYASYTIRIPQDKAEEYLDVIRTECQVLRESLSTEDITASYYDTQARLDSLLEQEERLTALLDTADSLDMLITLEDKLADVRAEINALYSQIQRMEGSVDYSYVYLTLNEVSSLTPSDTSSYWTSVGNTIVDAFATFVDVLGSIFIAFIWVFPFLLVGGVIAIVIIAVERRKKKRKGPQMNSTSEDGNHTADTEEKK